MSNEYSLDSYQSDAASFRLESASPQYALLNLAGEVGELSSLFAKGIRDGRKLDFDINVKKELGDILWSVAMVAMDHGYSLQDVALGNISKLSNRKINNTLSGSGDNR